ncbi:hypothetical protein L596_029303 [Steinernema carpocapsae]|uniref:Methyltransferase FkbM domain-containing protein n=1 Tax=Steinernema carpocapsae TaxID=34508 RepID=A0A4V6XVL7_STECR|nr:hypothetical protein L596_029303 [Steinernema carpocapsae]
MHIRRKLRASSQLFCYVFLTFSTFSLLCYLLFLTEPPKRQSRYGLHEEITGTMPPRIVYNKEVNLQRMLIDDGVRNYKDCLRFNEMAISLKDCLKSKMLPMRNEDYFANISAVATECGTEYLRRLFGGRFLMNRDDVKMLMLPKSNDDYLNVLTIGIGDDISAEMKMKSMFKNAKFYGADPIIESGLVYKELGEYIPVTLCSKAISQLFQTGVGFLDGHTNASVFENGKYHWEDIKVVTISQLMRKLGLEFVEFLLLDIEGAEYSVLSPLMTIEDYAFCQINVEIHGPLQDYGVEDKDFANLVRSILKPSSRYIPLWIPSPTMHHRFFLIDWKTRACVQKFFSHWC